MKKSVFFAMLLSFFVVFQLQAQTDEANASDKPRGGGSGKMDAATMASRETGWMKTNLNLSDEQYEKVLAISLEYAKKMEAARGSADEAPQKDVRQNMKAIDDAKAEAFKEVLTEEQMIKFNEFRTKRRGPAPGGEGRKPREKTNESAE